MNLIFSPIDYDSPQYRQTVQLRDEILRKPLNLHFTPEQLLEEASQIHIACFDANTKQILACLVLVPEVSPRIKMRQVAVAAGIQRQGIGQKLVTYAENHALKAGFTSMYCHARDTAVPFYLKLGYYTVGEPFTEVGITHYVMKKELV